ncbi:MAG: hypothetical protein KAH38_08160 [Candidatus Hydrogenedentes bacterium]|nr:hypothetical protein [Candidatus Hydrogenedentota bacterium]
MKVVDIIPKNISIITEFTLEEIESILFCLQHSTVVFEDTVPEEAAHVDYFTNTFFNILQDLHTRVADESRPDSL